MAESAKRRLTAEEAAAAEAEAENTTSPPSVRPAAAGPVTLATPAFLDLFEVPGVATITASGVELDAATAEKVLAAAEQSGITLREV